MMPAQVYERSAIEQHYLRAQTDPVTGTKVSTRQLTPIYLLRSRGHLPFVCCTHRE